MAIMAKGIARGRVRATTTGDGDDGGVAQHMAATLQPKGWFFDLSVQYPQLVLEVS